MTPNIKRARLQLSDEDKKLVFHDTAVSVYGLKL